MKIKAIAASLMFSLCLVASADAADKGGPGPGDKGIKPGTSTPSTDDKGGKKQESTKGANPNTAKSGKDRN